MARDRVQDLAVMLIATYWLSLFLLLKFWRRSIEIARVMSIIVVVSGLAA